MRIACAVFVASMLSACAFPGQGPFVGKDGRTSYAVECLDDEKNCDPKARELCPTGYSVTNTKSHLVAIWQGVDVVNHIRFRVTVECKD